MVWHGIIMYSMVSYRMAWYGIPIASGRRLAYRSWGRELKGCCELPWPGFAHQLLDPSTLPPICITEFILISAADIRMTYSFIISIFLLIMLWGFKWCCELCWSSIARPTHPPVDLHNWAFKSRLHAYSADASSLHPAFLQCGCHRLLSIYRVFFSLGLP